MKLVWCELFSSVINDFFCFFALSSINEFDQKIRLASARCWIVHFQNVPNARYWIVHFQNIPNARYSLHWIVHFQNVPNARYRTGVCFDVQTV